MISPAWKYRQRILLQRETAAAEAALKAKEQHTINKLASENGKFTLLLQSIENDCKRISALPKGQARTELKRELLKVYLPVIDAYIEGDEEYANAALSQVLIWLFDVGEIDKALDYAAVCIAQDQPLPERFNRDIKTYVADAFLEWAEAQLKSGHAVEPYFTPMLNDVLEWPVHEPIKLKYLRQAAKLAYAAEDFDAALDYCNKAEALNISEAKVKTLKKDIEKAILVRDEAAAAEAAKQKINEEE
jgi:hypothetical protein